MGTREYSERLGALTDEQLQSALDRFELGQLVLAEPIANGLFGQNLMLTTTSGDYVLRGAPHWNPAGEDNWQFQKERFFSRLMHESDRGPVVAWPYLLEESRDIFGWGFAIQPRLRGGPLSLPLTGHYSEAELRQQAAELGRALAAVHTVAVPASGTHDPVTDSIRPFETTYAEYVETTIEGLLAGSVAASAATRPEDEAWAGSIISEGRAAMALPFQPTVAHLDFGHHNVLFEQRDSVWRITGVIDWMTAEAGHPECDLARPLATFQQYKTPGREEFLAAYREAHAETEGFRERLPVFVLWERMLIWNYWQRNNGFKEGLGMRAWMEPFVRMSI